MLTLDPLLEQALISSIQQGDDGRFLALSADQAEHLGRAMSERLVGAENAGWSPVLVCSPVLRPALRRFVARVLPQLPLLSYEELSDHLTIETLGTVNLEHPVEV